MSDPKKLWVIKESDGCSVYKESGDLNDIKLSCDCSCTDCKSIYLSYLAEKSLNKLLNEALSAEKAEVTLMITMIEDAEKAQATALKKLEEALTDEESKHANIVSILNHERKLRMESIYDSDLVKKENNTLNSEKNKLERQLSDMSRDLFSIENENRALKSMVSSSNARADKLFSQLRLYEHELSNMDRVNVSLRLRSQTNGHVAKDNYVERRTSSNCATKLAQASALALSMCTERSKSTRSTKPTALKLTTLAGV